MIVWLLISLVGANLLDPTAKFKKPIEIKETEETEKCVKFSKMKIGEQRVACEKFIGEGSDLGVQEKVYRRVFDKMRFSTKR